MAKTGVIWEASFRGGVGHLHEIYRLVFENDASFSRRHVILHSTRAKVNHVLSSREGKGGGDIDKVLGPPLRGGKRRSLGAKVNQRPIYST